MRRGLWQMSVAVVVVIVATACGSSKAKPATSVTTTKATAPTSSTGSSGGGANTIKLHLTVNGDYKGQSVQGSVVPGSLQCTPITTGGKQGLQLTWGGTLNGTGQISGDMMFAGGAPSVTFGDPKAQGEASVVIKGDYQNRYGASSALGSGTASSNPDNSGMIDAELDGGSAGKIHLQGSWTC